MSLSATRSAIVVYCFLAFVPLLPAQVRTTSPTQTPTAQEPTPQGPEQVIVEREAMKLIDPEVYQVPLKLLPSNFISVVSPATGMISALPVKAGDQLSAQTELFRLQDKTQELQVKRAEAKVELQQLLLDQAKKKGDADAQAVAAAELKVADLELQIATAQLEKTVVRTDAASEVFRTYAVKGELVSLYQKVMDIGDPTKMVVEIPVNRADVKQDGTISIKVEDEEIEGKVVAVLPPAERFEPLRELYDSLASARVEIENRNRKLKAGQAVYVSSIPREAVSEVPNSAIVSEEEGKRKVQIIRKNVVRDIIISVLAPVGADRSFVTGSFQPEDELILTTSLPLADGTQLSPKVTNQSASGQSGNPNPRAGGF